MTLQVMSSPKSPSRTIAAGFLMSGAGPQAGVAFVRFRTAFVIHNGKRRSSCDRSF